MRPPMRGAGRFPATFDNSARIATRSHHGWPHRTIDNGPRSFQPMNINFGLFLRWLRRPPEARRDAFAPATKKTIAKRRAISARALSDLDY